jgi:hypothetical protein
VRVALGFVGPALFAVGLIWLYFEGICTDGDCGSASATPYVLMGLGGAVMALRLIRRLFHRK